MSHQLLRPCHKLTQRQRQILELAPFFSNKETALKADISDPYLCAIADRLQDYGFLSSTPHKLAGQRHCRLFLLTDAGHLALGRPTPTPLIELHVRALVAHEGNRLTAESETLLWLAVEAQHTRELPTPERLLQELLKRQQLRSDTLTPATQP